MAKRKTKDLPENAQTVAASVGEILLYQTEDGLSRIEVRLEDETVWLTQSLMAELFQTTKQNTACIFKMYTRKVNC